MTVRLVSLTGAAAISDDKPDRGYIRHDEDGVFAVPDEWAAELLAQRFGHGPAWRPVDELPETGYRDVQAEAQASVDDAVKDEAARTVFGDWAKDG